MYAGVAEDFIYFLFNYSVDSEAQRSALHRSSWRCIDQDINNFIQSHHVRPASRVLKDTI